jgi:S-adenosylmethionine hydrolase
MIITLLSDFGLHDSFVAVAKGILLQQLPEAVIVDLSHEVTPYHLLQCSYNLQTAYGYFPSLTIHLSLFDILHHKPSDILVTRIKNQIILSSDNGLLPLTFGDQLSLVYCFKAQATQYVSWVAQAAACIKDLAQHQFSLDHLPVVDPSVSTAAVKPVFSGNTVECQVMHVDRYGNVVINMHRDLFEQLSEGKKFRLNIVRDTLTQLSNDYTDVSAGNKLCLFNSSGYLEIAINQGNAAQLLGLQLHSEKNLFYQNIKIEFQI